MRTAPLLLLLAVVKAPAAEAPRPTAEALEHFEKHVRPILVEHCHQCHGEKKQQAGLRLDSAAGLKKGADSGAVVVPGDPAKSSLIASVKRTGDFPMPPNRSLTKEQIAVLEAWVRDGAAFPAGAPNAVDANAAKKHWAYQPIREPKVPTAAGSTDIDKFLNVRIAAKGMTPAPPADKRTLARRLYYDLLGLPPTADELDRFEMDTDPRAYAKLVDTLLASPHYGERWGRYWLDLARYADTKGYVFNEDRNYPYAYTYRDYVIRSFNEDKPFNRFILEQIAADKLPDADKPSLAAMGFLTVGRRFTNNTHDIIDDRIDLISRGLMGITVACARCHDHKYDPIPAADYYSLYGIFASSGEPKDLPLIGEVPDTPEFREFQAKLKTMQDTVDNQRRDAIAKRTSQLMALTGSGIAIPKPEGLLNRADRDALTKVQKQLDQFVAKSPFNPPRAMVMTDNAKPFEPFVFLRGSNANRGPNVPRRMPEILGARVNFTQGSGRLEMAKAIVDPSNPLTARVFVNRVWLGHFGQGLVRTPSDFGVRTEPPPQPELLDYLARRFMDDGWSVKMLHRRILMSDAYRRGSAATAEALQADPENLYFARQNRRRLDFEATRDSLLVAAGQLDRTVGGRSVDLFTAPFPKRRAVYAQIDRQNLPGTMRAFDLASPDQHSPQRFQTTVPQQALYMLNNPFVVERARDVAKRAEVAKAASDPEKLTAMYRAVMGRNPRPEEAKAALGFVADAAKDKPAPSHLAAWEQLAQVLLLGNEFLFVD
jgi:mono/diheme cytochrome c family protein